MRLRQTTKFRQGRPKGFTLTELAIVLAIIGILIGAIWIAVAQVNEKMRARQAVDQFHAIAQNMTALLQGGFGSPNSPSPCSMSGAVASSGSPPTCDFTGVAAADGVVPSQWIVASAPWGLSNPWGPPNGSAPPALGGTMLWWNMLGPKYAISFYYVSHQGCIALLSEIVNCQPGQPGCPTVINTAVNSGVGGVCSLISPAGNPPQCTTLPLTPAEIDANCARNSYTGSGNNSVEFGFDQ